MSIVTGQLVQAKISAGSVAAFGQSLRTFVPQFQVCPERPAFDYAGREAPADSLDTQVCPGAYPADLRIQVENSLRPFVSEKYFNLPIGVSGGADTMFGNMNVSRANAFGYREDFPVAIQDLSSGNFQGANNVDGSAIALATAGLKKAAGLSITPEYK